MKKPKQEGNGDKMRGTFFLLALLSGILGIFNSLESLWVFDTATLLSGVMLLLNSAGWAGVAKLSDKVERLSETST